MSPSGKKHSKHQDGRSENLSARTGGDQRRGKTPLHALGGDHVTQKDRAEHPDLRGTRHRSLTPAPVTSPGGAAGGPPPALPRAREAWHKRRLVSRRGRTSGTGLKTLPAVSRNPASEAPTFRGAHLSRPSSPGPPLPRTPPAQPPALTRPQTAWAPQGRLQAREQGRDGAICQARLLATTPASTLTLIRIVGLESAKPFASWQPLECVQTPQGC